MSTQKSNGSADTSLDPELARLVVESQFATQSEVDQCMALRKQLAEQGSYIPLSDLLAKRGIVTESQLSRLKTKLTPDESRGQQIPGYKFISRLGSGAMANVFKARQLSLDRIVAVKVLPRKLSESADYVSRFYKEGKAAAKLNHPNIVQAIDVGEAGGFHYFVMEYVEGHTLHEMLLEGKPLEESEALRIIIQIARALEHAHKQGLIHRDVKPKNIMMTLDGTPKLADMGLARAITDAQAAQAEAGRAFGTPYYISPEQIRGELHIDFRADIYSLGATLYHMVTGQVPFDAPTPAAVMHKHLKEQLIPPDHINTKLSAGIGEVVEVMMAKDRERRYASTSDLLLDLEAIASGEPPLQARKQIDSGLLSNLTGEANVEDVATDTEVLVPFDSNMIIYMILLGGALALSLIGNLFLLLR